MVAHNINKIEGPTKSTNITMKESSFTQIKTKTMIHKLGQTPEIDIQIAGICQINRILAVRRIK